MTAQKDPIGIVIEKLEKIAANVERQPGWAGDLDQLLSTAEQELRQRKAPLKADGKLVDVEAPRMPSPTIARRTVGLRKELSVLIQETEELRTRLKTDDADDVREQIHALAGSLQDYIDDEARLVLKSVNTDIGGND